jgi:hypothetical protein
MMMDEQVETIEHTNQESIMVRDKKQEAKVVEAQRRGMMLLE